MKDVLLSNAGIQIYIIDGSRRTDAAARAVINALYNAGRICKESAERAWSDRPTLDKIKKNMIHAQMETRETETGKRWTFYTKSGVYMDISAYSRNYIRADKQGNLYPVEAPTTEKTSTTAQDTTCTDREPQEGTETAQKTTDMETFKKAYTAAYSHLYDHAYTPAVKAKIRIYSALFDEQWEQIKDTAKAFCQIAGDLITSDRECAAFMIALEAVGAPTDGNSATDGETTTTTETKPQRAAESAEKAADDTTTTARDTEPHRAAQSHETTTSRKSITTTTEPRRKPHRRPESAKAQRLPPHPIQSHHEPLEVYHRATAEHAQQPHRATERQRAYNATTDHRKRHTEQHREPRRVSCATLPPRPPADGRQKKVIFWPVWDQRKF